MDTISASRNKLPEIRKNLGISQSKLASLIGITKRTLIRWEKSDQSPDDSELLKFLYNIGINPFYLYYNEPLFRDGYDLYKVWNLVSNLK